MQWMGFSFLILGVLIFVFAGYSMVTKRVYMAGREFAWRTDPISFILAVSIYTAVAALCVVIYKELAGI